MHVTAVARERIGATALLLTGVASSLISINYGLGTLRSIGPGFFPFSLGLIIALLSAVLLIKSARIQEGESEIFRPKVPIFISLAIVGFALLLKPIGLIGAIAFCVFVSMLAMREYNLKAAVLLSAGISLCCVAVFSWGLKQPLPIFGRLLVGF